MDPTKNIVSESHGTNFGVRSSLGSKDEVKRSKEPPTRSKLPVEVVEVIGAVHK